jgi:hypothetical protein
MPSVNACTNCKAAVISNGKLSTKDCAKSVIACTAIGISVGSCSEMELIRLDTISAPAFIITGNKSPIPCTSTVIIHYSQLSNRKITTKTAQ